MDHPGQVGAGFFGVDQGGAHVDAAAAQGVGC